MPSIPWTTSTADLRTYLSDGPTDKSARRKALFGRKDGSNRVFYSFEFRRVTDFTSAVAPLGVYVANSLVSVSSDDVATGTVTLTAAPTNTQVVEATYYYQWFTDAELAGFVQNALLWMGFGTDPTTLAGPMIPAALEYASKDAYIKMAQRWRERASSAFQMEDAPRKEALDVATGFESLADKAFKRADQLLSNFWSRQHQAEQPYFNTAYGAVRPVTPRR